MPITIRDGNYTALYTHPGDSLREADLSGLNLEGARLLGNDLRGVNFSRTNLRGACLEDSNLSLTNLEATDFRLANLEDVDFEGAEFKKTKLQGAKLCGAHLRDAFWEDPEVILKDYIAHCHKDFVNTVNLLRSNGEVQYLNVELITGRINGQFYVDGRCLCLVGTLIKAQGQIENFETFCSTRNYICDASNPAEQWFLQILTGDTPETNFFSAEAVRWCDEIIAADQAKQK